MFTHPKCGKSWTGLKLEHCPICCETFTNTPAGDAHRVGEFHDNTRRCLTPEEMRSRLKRPLEQNEKGYWTFAASLQNGPQWLSVLTRKAQNPAHG